MNITNRHSLGRLKASSDGNISYSSLTFIPSVKDGGQFLTCQAENPEVPTSVIEDNWKLDVHCKFDICSVLQVNGILPLVKPFYFDTFRHSTHFSIELFAQD